MKNCISNIIRVFVRKSLSFSVISNKVDCIDVNFYCNGISVRAPRTYHSKNDKPRDTNLKVSIIKQNRKPIDLEVKTHKL